MKGGFDEVDFGEEVDCAPGSIQPVVSMDGENLNVRPASYGGASNCQRDCFWMRDREGVAKANFWKDKFATNRCIVPASSFFEWKNSKKGPKPKYETTVRAFIDKRLTEFSDVSSVREKYKWLRDYHAKTLKRWVRAHRPDSGRQRG